MKNPSVLIQANGVAGHNRPCNHIDYPVVQHDSMKSYRATAALFTVLVSVLLMSCDERPRHADTHFTKADSITDTFLALEDSMREAWNLMIHDDNHKLEAMQNILHELQVSGATNQELLSSFTQRLRSLKNSRYTQKTMANEDVIEEYDFASNALVTELVALAEAQRQFAYNTTLQKLVDNIKTADQRVAQYREAYDEIALRYNTFIEKNREYLHGVHEDSFPAKKPLFQMAGQ